MRVVRITAISLCLVTSVAVLSGCDDTVHGTTTAGGAAKDSAKEEAAKASNPKRIPMAYLMALDQGTSSSRCMIFHPDGRVAGSGQQALPASYPQPGWVEQDPWAIWETQWTAIQQAMAQSGNTPPPGMENFSL